MKDKDYLWNATYQKAFNHVRSLVCGNTSLQYYFVHKPVIILVDTSRCVLCIALLQMANLMTFMFKNLTPAEQHYANIKKELLAAVHGSECFNMHVFG